MHFWDRRKKCDGGRISQAPRIIPVDLKKLQKVAVLNKTMTSMADISPYHGPREGGH